MPGGSLLGFADKVPFLKQITARRGEQVAFVRRGEAVSHLPVPAALGAAAARCPGGGSSLRPPRPHWRAPAPRPRRHRSLHCAAAEHLGSWSGAAPPSAEHPAPRSGDSGGRRAGGDGGAVPAGGRAAEVGSAPRNPPWGAAGRARSIPPSPARGRRRGSRHPPLPPFKTRAGGAS